MSTRASDCEMRTIDVDVMANNSGSDQLVVSSGQDSEEHTHLALITPTVKAPLCVDYRTFSPCRVGDKMHAGTQNGRYRRILHDVADIDEIQGSKDPNYSRTYAWSIARMMQDEEELLVQRSPNNFAPHAPTIIPNDISYPWLCSNQTVFPSHQTDVNSEMHQTLVDWFVRVCNERGLNSSTLCHAVHLLDAFLHREPAIPSHRFQLLGCTCLILAAKLEQVKFPHIDELVHISNYCFKRGDLIEMEGIVLAALDYNVSIPTRLYFLNRFMLAAQVDICPVPAYSSFTDDAFRVCDDSESRSSSSSVNLHQHQIDTDRNYKEACFAYYLVDLTLQNFAFNQYPMSVVAAAIVHYVKQQFRRVNELIWTPTLVFYTGYEERHLIPVVYAIQAIHAAAYSSVFVTVVKKYHCRQYCYCSSELALSVERIRFDTAAAQSISKYYETVAVNMVDEEVHDEGGVDDDESAVTVNESGGGREGSVIKDRVNMTPTSLLATETAEGVVNQSGTGSSSMGEGFVDYVLVQRNLTHNRSKVTAPPCEGRSSEGVGGGGRRLEFSGPVEGQEWKRMRSYSDD